MSSPQLIVNGSSGKRKVPMLKFLTPKFCRQITGLNVDRIIHRFDFSSTAPSLILRNQSDLSVIKGAVLSNFLQNFSII